MFLVAALCTLPQSLNAGIRVDTKKILLLNAYPEAARTLSKEMSSALIISNNRHMSVARKKELLLKSVMRARDAMNGIDLEKGFLNDVKNHLKMLERAVQAADFKTAADIVGSYDKALRTYVFVVDESEDPIFR
jgi:hypothetical protein